MIDLAVLTDSLHPNLIDDDQVLFEAFASQGIRLVPVIWDQVNWRDFPNILIRSPWDYAQKRELFIQKIQETKEANINLIHGPEIIMWNIDKSYLLSLQGEYSIPTLIFENFTLQDISTAFDKLGTQIVLKPKIGAGGKDTFRLKQDDKFEFCQNLVGQPVIAQAFIESILSDGEYSFIYFESKFSHAILKQAKRGEFRVQDDHGGTVKAYEPTLQERDSVLNILAKLPFKTQYARVDLVRHGQSFLVMEVELIEPELFFRFNPMASQHFAQTIKTKLL